MWGVLNNNKIHVYRINGMEDHIHILMDLHPSLALADVIRDLKTASSIWLKDSELFPNFAGWASGYGAFTYSYWDKDKLINYIINQQEHHRKESFQEEYRRFLKEHHIEIDEEYFLT
jgi:REP element-mobilizing transposase RayT